MVHLSFLFSNHWELFRRIGNGAFEVGLMEYVTRSPAIPLVSHEMAFKGQEASAGSEFNVKGGG